MAKDDPFYEMYKAQIANDRRKLEQRYETHTPPSRRHISSSGPRSSDEYIHRLAFGRVAAESNGQSSPRRNDQPVFKVVPKPGEPS